MYGVINKSLRDMMVEQYGDLAWGNVLQRSGCPHDSFLAMRSYDDSVTYHLAQAAAEELGIELDDALRAFGVHWIEHTIHKHYDTLARAAGSNLIQFLSNLNALHDRISSTFLDYQPPEFDIRTRDDGVVELTYVSQRVGLTPFVEGLITGLGKRFGETVVIHNIESIAVSSGEKSLFTLTIG